MTECNNGFMFFATYDDPGVQGVDGIMGLSFAQLDHPVPSFMSKLIQSGLISRPIIGISLQAGNTVKSQIRFGGYNEELIKFGNKIHWYNIQTTNEWKLQIFDSIYGRDRFWVGNTSVPVEINPSTPLISMPKSRFKVLSQLWMEGQNPDAAVCTDILCLV